MISFFARLQAKESETVSLSHIGDKDFETGGLKQKSNIRPNRLFTAHRQLVLYQAGHLKLEKVNEVIRKISDLLER
jgi:mRNA interferase MazF